MLMPSIFRNDIFDDLFGNYITIDRPMAMYKAPASDTMRTDVKELENGYSLRMELPGYSKEDVTAELKDGYMIVTAKSASKDEKTGEDGKYIYRERFTGTSSRSFYVGEQITEEDIEASFADGILSIFIPKKEAKPQVEEKKYIAIAG